MYFSGSTALISPTRPQRHSTRSLTSFKINPTLQPLLTQRLPNEPRNLHTPRRIVLVLIRLRWEPVVVVVQRVLRRAGNRSDVFLPVRRDDADGARAAGRVVEVQDGGDFGAQGADEGGVAGVVH